jgi:hypothetical protein
MNRTMPAKTSGGQLLVRDGGVVAPLRALGFVSASA